MKKTLSILYILFLSVSLFAQVDSTEISLPEPKVETQDSTKLTTPEKISEFLNPKDTLKRFKTRLIMLDFGESMLLHKGKANLPDSYADLEQQFWGSKHWALHLVIQKIYLDKKRRFNFNYGITLDFNRYRFQKENFRLLEEQNDVTFTALPDDTKKSFLTTTYFQVPVFFEFKGKPIEGFGAFSFGVGGFAGRKIASKIRYKTESDGRQKIRDNFNLNKFRYGILARAGVGPIRFYANYSLSELFIKDDNSGFQLNPLSFGIIFIPF